MTLTLPRETTEFLPATVTVDGVAVTAGVQFALARFDARPTTWVNAYILDARIGYLYVGSGTPLVGTYRLWAKITDSPEIPVLIVGIIEFS